LSAAGLARWRRGAAWPPLLVVCLWAGCSADSAADSQPIACKPATVADFEQRQGAFYRCVDARVADGAGCGETGYLLGYGAKYADRFMSQTYAKLSPAGQVFLVAAGVCLQERMAEQVPTAATCTELWEFGFKSHTGCYVGAGFCDLASADVGLIASTVEAPDWAIPEQGQQLTDISARCAAK